MTTKELSLKQRIDLVKENAKQANFTALQFDKGFYIASVHATKVIKELEEIIELQKIALKNIAEKTSIGCGYYPEKMACEINEEVNEALEKTNQLLEGKNNE